MYVRARSIVMPVHVHQRMVSHSLATVTGVAFAVRMAPGNPWWVVAGWYCGAFVGFHVAMIPFVAMWIVMTSRAERFVRGIVEEELTRYDLRVYGEQFRRLLPYAHRQPGEPPASAIDESSRDGT